MKISNKHTFTHSVLTLILIFCAAALSLKIYLKPGIPYTHDGENHVARFANYWIAIKEGQIPPRFAPNLINHYGYPVFNYNYPLSNMLSLPLTAAGSSFQVSFKLLASLTVFLGIVGVMAWLWVLGSDTFQIRLGIILAALSPWLLSTITYRGNIGELFSWAILPWIFTWMHLIAKKQNWWMLLLGISIGSAFSLSHNTSVLLMSPVIASYALLLAQKNLTIWKNYFKVAAGSLGMTIWFWLPALAEKKYITLDAVAFKHSVTDHLVSLHQLIFSPLGFGFSNMSSLDTLSFSWGWWSWLLLILALVAIFKQKNIKAVEAWSLIWICICFVILTTPILDLPGFNQLAPFIQFPWRVNSIVAIVIIPLLTQRIVFHSQVIKTVLVALLIIAALASLRAIPVDYRNASDEVYLLFSESTSTNNENLPKGFSYKDFAYWKPEPMFSTPPSQMTVQTWTGTYRKYNMSLSQPTTISEPTMWFPGWETYINSKKIEYTLEESKGLINYELPAGEYTVHTRFTQNTWPRIISNSITIVTFSVLLIYSAYILNFKNLLVKKRIII